MHRFNGTLEKPSAVFFDWDGTLVDSLAFLTNVHNEVRTKLGIFPELSKKEFKPYLGKPRDIIFQELYGDKAEQGKDGFAECYLKNHLNDIHLIDGAQEFLDVLCKQNIDLGVVSNKRGDFLRQEIEHLGWNTYFHDRVIGSGDTAEDKPSATPLNFAISLLGKKIDDERIWYVGDTDIDLQCAKNANVIGILYNPELMSVSDANYEYEPSQKHFFIKKYEEICCFLLQSL